MGQGVGWRPGLRPGLVHGLGRQRHREAGWAGPSVRVPGSLEAQIQVPPAARACGTSRSSMGRRPGVAGCSGSLYSLRVRAMVMRGASRLRRAAREAARGHRRSPRAPRCAGHQEQHPRIPPPALSPLWQVQVHPPCCALPMLHLNPMEMSFLGLRERCQYWHSATGLGSSTPAVYTACQMSCRFTRRVISCN